MVTEKLPQNWMREPFIKCVEKNVSFNNLKIPQKDFKDTGKYPIIDQSVNFIAGYTDDAEKIYNGELPVILFGDHTRIFKYVDFPFALGADGVKVLIPKKNKLIPKYFYYFLKGLNIESHGYSRHYKFLQRKQIIIPPLETQTKIFQILEKVGQLMLWREEADNLTDEYLSSVFLKMFGDPAVNEKNWEFKTLNDVCDKITDGTHNSPPNSETGDFPYVTAKNITKRGIDLRNITYVSEEVHKEIYKRCNPVKGDILYIKDGATTGIAQVNNLNFEFSLLSSVALLKPSKIIDSYYLMYLLNFPSIYKKIRNKMGGAAITRLTLTKIKRISVPVPPIVIQKRFAQIVTDINGLRKTQEKSRKLVADLFNCSQQRAFVGELSC